MFSRESIVGVERHISAVTEFPEPNLLRVRLAPFPDKGRSESAPFKQVRPDSHHSAPSHKRQYEKRKAAGLCAQTGCSASAEASHKHCRQHLERMAKGNRERVNARKRKGLCIYCGTYPQFWGVRCITCRQRFVKDPLPSKARQALRLFREAEKRFEVEQIQVRARLDVRKLLAGGYVNGDRAKALGLYAGLDSGQWRTYSEVATLMSLSKERVRQLLKPSKIALARSLGSDVPWKHRF